MSTTSPKTPNQRQMPQKRTPRPSIRWIKVQLLRRSLMSPTRSQTSSTLAKLSRRILASLPQTLKTCLISWGKTQQMRLKASCKSQLSKCNLLTQISLTKRSEKLSPFCPNYPIQFKTMKNLWRIPRNSKVYLRNNRIRSGKPLKSLRKSKKHSQSTSLMISKKAESRVWPIRRTNQVGASQAIGATRKS